MIYRGEGGGGKRGVGNGGFLGGHMVFSGKGGGGISRRQQSKKGGEVGCRKLIAT